MSSAQAAEVKSKIVSVASDLFRQNGFEAVSMRRLAKAIGVSPMTLYSYFPSKLAILSHLWLDIFEDVGAQMMQAASKQTDPQDRLNAMAQTYVAYWLDHRDHYFLVFMSGGLSRGDVSSFVTEGSAVAKFEPFFQIMAEVTGTDPRGSVVKRRVDQLLCGLHGAMHCIITIPGYDWSSADQLVRAMVQDVCRL